METQKTTISQNSLEKKKKGKEKNKAGQIRLSYSDYTSYKSTAIKTVWYCHKNSNVNKHNRIESPEINAFTFRQLISDKVSKTI